MAKYLLFVKNKPNQPGACTCVGVYETLEKAQKALTDEGWGEVFVSL